MKAPTDKTNDTIQVLVTRACDLFWCSNCTQMLPFRKDSVHMSVDVFREAVASLVDWPGIVGVFGGNPCVHPRFPDLCEIIADLIPPHRRGLWTNNLMGYGEIAARTFDRGRLNLNPHGDADATRELNKWFPGRVKSGGDTKASWHSPVLMNYQDLGMSKAKWVAARERCDINTHWSAAIMERDGRPYAYFCEVAGAIDGVTGENHGVPVEPGWWAWKMNRFGHQVKGCCDAGCGVPLRGLGHKDLDNTYDLTARWVPLTVTKSPRVKREIHETMPEGTELATDYLAHETRKPA